MVSRDTVAQIGAILVYVVLLVVWTFVSGGTDAAESLFDPVDLLFATGSLFLVFAGAHLYLAWRGEGGMVPVDARWRFVAVVGASLGLAVVAVSLLDVEPVAGVRPHLPVVGAVLALLVGYFVYEAREGYLERKPE